MITGYYDNWDRTTTNGLGVADSGQTYSLNGVATQFSTDGFGVITIAAAGENFGYIDLQTSDVDITAIVSMNQAPASNLCTVGYVAKLASTSNYYSGTMMVATGGAISLRFSKMIAGALTTISTTATGLPTFVNFQAYRLRYSIFWSEVLQTNVMQSKLWVDGTAEPGGWMAVAFDSSLTKYTAGTKVGYYGRDESSVLGTQEVYTDATAVRSYSLPIPAVTDPMCYDPAVAYPRQTGLESLADAADTAMTAIDPLVSLSGLFPRVRVSNSSLSIPTSSITITPVFASTEFNVGTPTNLSYDNQSISLGVGIWMVFFEMQLSPTTSDYLLVNFVETDSSAAGAVSVDMRSNLGHTGDLLQGGCVRMSKIAVVTDPATPAKFSILLSPNNVATTYTALYMALSAIKISDYFA